MADITITAADVGALADRLDTMTDQFSERELAALHAVFGLAGASAAAGHDGGDDVHGFGGPAGQIQIESFSWGVSQTGILIGLSQRFAQGARLPASGDPHKPF